MVGAWVNWPEEARHDGRPKLVVLPMVIPMSMMSKHLSAPIAVSRYIVIVHMVQDDVNGMPRPSCTSGIVPTHAPDFRGGRSLRHHPAGRIACLPGPSLW